MSKIAIPSVLTDAAIPSSAHRPENPAKIRDAAQQFEGLLIAEMLKAANGDSGWMGSGSDSAGSCATGFAQEQLASLMAKSGGFGLAKMIAEGLATSSSPGQPAQARPEELRTRDRLPVRPDPGSGEFRPIPRTK